MTNDNYLSVPEAHSYLRIGRSTLYTLMSAGRIPYYKVGARTLLRRSDLDEYVNASLTRTTPRSSGAIIAT